MHECRRIYKLYNCFHCILYEIIKSSETYTIINFLMFLLIRLIHYHVNTPVMRPIVNIITIIMMIDHHRHHRRHHVTACRYGQPTKVTSAARPFCVVQNNWQRKTTHSLKSSLSPGLQMASWTSQTGRGTNLQIRKYACLINTADVQLNNKLKRT